MAMDPKNKNAKSDLIDESISFEQRDMHKTWPFIKGCLMLFLGLGAFIMFSIFIFKKFSDWF